jgi:hypothetical protein
MSGPVVYDYRFVLHNVGGHPVAFEAANQDLTDPVYQYFGFVSSFGSWIVQRFKISVSGTTIIYGYCAGKNRADYDALWNTSGVYIGALTFTTFDLISAS